METMKPDSATAALDIRQLITSASIVLTRTLLQRLATTHSRSRRKLLRVFSERLFF